jgi:uncharacterized protein (TIGR03089 family)
VTQPVSALLAAALAADSAKPLFTQYDDATGERVELSAVTFDNWVAKTANLLQDTGAEPGAVAAVLLPPHWQTGAIMLGCWAAGLAISHSDDIPGDVAFAAADRLGEAAKAGEVYGLSLAPLAAPLRDVPPGVSDYSTEVRVHGDRFTPYAPVDPASAALVFGGRPPVSQGQLVDAARERASELGLSAGDRVLIVDAPRPLDWLLAPLAAGASVVLLRNADPAKIKSRADAERTTRTLP